MSLMVNVSVEQTAKIQATIVKRHAMTLEHASTDNVNAITRPASIPLVSGATAAQMSLVQVT